MSIEFPDALRDRRMALIFKMLDEMTEALDEMTPLPRRRAIIYKWCVVTRAMGLHGEECSLVLPPSELEAKAAKLLEASSNTLRKRW